MAQYYRLNLGRCTYGEFWRLSRNPIEFALAALLKTCGLLGSAPGGLGRPELLIPLAIADLPPRVFAKLESWLAPLQQLGFAHGFAYTIPMVGAQEGFAIALRGQNPLILASLVYGRQRSEGTQMEQSAFAFLTPLQGTDYLVTSGKKKELESAPQARVERLPGADVHTVYARHQQRIAATPDTVPIRTEAEFNAFVLRYNLDEFDYFLQRGLYSPMSSEEAELQKAVQLAFQSEP
ncbi:MAG: hypothetical protein AB7F89_08635 [Pirellulaceae bacterium]